MCGSMTFFGLRGQVVQQQLMLMNFKGTVPNYDAKHNFESGIYWMLQGVLRWQLFTLCISGWNMQNS